MRMRESSSLTQLIAAVPRATVPSSLSDANRKMQSSSPGVATSSSATQPSS